jgi:ribosomal protein S18 acetylase RimI-like enzyme
VTITATSKSTSARLAELPFETEIFGYPVCRLDLSPGTSLPRREEIRAKILAKRCRLVSCRIDAEAEHLANGLIDLGFEEVEQLATFESAIPPKREMPTGITVAGAETADACAEIARQSFQFDRFHADSHIPKPQADAFKAAWAGNNARGRADVNLVAMRESEVVGFNQCLLRNGVAVIDLIAVSPKAQGQGLGRALVGAALAAYHGKALRMRVGTQVSNEPSIALYRRCGMVQVGLSRTFHLWA